MDATKVETQMTQLQQLVGLVRHDITSLAAGTKRGATDARKRLSQISKLTTQMRAECLNVQKSIPTRSRVKKPSVEPEQPEPEPEIQDIEDLPPSPLQLKREMTSVSPEGVPSVRKPRTTRKPRRGRRTGL